MGCSRTTKTENETQLGSALMMHRTTPFQWKVKLPL